ncbi:helix-turn-helix domain-containing protein [Lentzea sp. NPDC004789]
MSGRVAIELAAGFGDGQRNRLAAPVGAAVEMAVGVAFQVDGGVTEAVAIAFRDALQAESVVEGDRGHASLPSRTVAEVAEVCRTVVAGLREPRVWVGVVAGDARADASDLVGVVTALELPPGVYRREDVEVEYAAVRSRASAAVLRRLIAPVMAVDVLRGTLAALIAEGGNRTSAAERLFIHRSTIDYRLARIEQLTGRCPVTVRGLSILTAAYALSVGTG